MAEVPHTDFDVATRNISEVLHIDLDVVRRILLTIPNAQPYLTLPTT